ncbi:hypothetical protein GEMRC1_004110 [Eukaryota sp. GEM-RC1]
MFLPTLYPSLTSFSFSLKKPDILLLNLHSLPSLPWLKSSKLTSLPIVSPHIPSILSLCRNTEAESVVSNASLTIRNIIQACSINEQILSTLFSCISGTDVPAAKEACSHGLVSAIRTGLERHFLDGIIKWLRSSSDFETCPFKKPVFMTLVDSGLWIDPNEDQNDTFSFDLDDEPEPMIADAVVETVVQTDNDDFHPLKEVVSEVVVEEPVLAQEEVEKEPEVVVHEEQTVLLPKKESVDVSVNEVIKDKAPEPHQQSNQQVSNQTVWESKYNQEVRFRVELQDILSQYEATLTSVIDQQNEFVALNLKNLLCENSDLTSRYNELELNFKQLSLRYEELKKLVVSLKRMNNHSQLNYPKVLAPKIRLKVNT